MVLIFNNCFFGAGGSAHVTFVLEDSLESNWLCASALRLELHCGIKKKSNNKIKCIPGEDETKIYYFFLWHYILALK